MIIFYSIILTRFTVRPPLDWMSEISMNCDSPLGLAASVKRAIISEECLEALRRLQSEREKDKQRLGGSNWCVSWMQALICMANLDKDLSWIEGVVNSGNEDRNYDLSAAGNSAELLREFLGEWWLLIPCLLQINQLLI